MNKSIITAVFLATLSISQPVWAHTDESLDAIPSPPGGQVRAAGPYHMELVAKEEELVVYVTDHASIENNTNGGEGKASTQPDKTGSKITVRMEPSQNNMFTGIGEFQINPEAVIAVFVKLPEQDGYAARFTPLKPKSVGEGKKAGDDHDHHDQHK